MCCSNRGTVAGRVRSLSDTWEKRDGLQSVGGGEEADSVVGKRGGAFVSTKLMREKARFWIRTMGVSGCRNI